MLFNWLKNNFRMSNYVKFEEGTNKKNCICCGKEGGCRTISDVSECSNSEIQNYIILQSKINQT